MARIDLSEIFLDIFEAMKSFVPESDHVEVCVDAIRALEDKGYNIKELYGHDETIDEALEELYPELSDDYDDDDEKEY